MKLNMYAVLDKVSEFFMNPFFLTTDGAARRAVVQASLDPKTEFHTNPHDYELYKLAEYDNTDGSITPINMISLGTVAANKVDQHNHGMLFPEYADMSKANPTTLEDLKNGENQEVN
jgi:hypothetical protein